ncbi:unnamed protein product, partial [Mesorhabditis spiculigera]
MCCAEADLGLDIFTKAPFREIYLSRSCSTDEWPTIGPLYDINLMRAHATSQVFKYADSNQLYFTLPNPSMPKDDAPKMRPRRSAIQSNAS